MTERPDDFDDQLREGLENLAGEASPPPKAPPGVLSSARRRIGRNTAALALVVVLVVGGVVAGYGLTGGNGSTPVPIGSLTGPSPAPTSAPFTTMPATSAPVTSAPATTSPTPPTSIGRWKGPVRTMLFIDGVVYFFPVGVPPQAGPGVVGIVPDDTAVQPPVSAPAGVVVLGGRAGDKTRLWLLTGGAPILLATGVDGFAVSADGSRIAYSTPDVDPGISTITEGPLARIKNVHSESVIDTSVRVIGFVGSDVIVDSGDGAAARAAIWTPDSTSVRPLEGYGTAVATDPASGFAVLTEGDGRCWVIALLGPAGNAGIRRPKHGPGCGIAQASFEPGGDAMAGIMLTSEDRSGPQRFIVAGATSQLGGETDLDGAFQTWWKGMDGGAPTILVMSEPDPNHFTVTECRVSENLCSSDPVWSGTGQGGPGTAWMVEERPAQ